MFTLVRSKEFGRHFGYAALAYMFSVRDPFGDNRFAVFLSNQKCLLYYISMSKRECKMKL
jgi:hypothetical protein